GSPYLLSEADAGTLEFQDTGRHHKFIVQLRRSMVSGADGVDDKDDIFALQYALIKTKGTHQLGAGALHEFQVIDVVNNTAGVGILKVDTGSELEWPPGDFSRHNVVPDYVLASRGQPPIGIVFFSQDGTGASLIDQTDPPPAVPCWPAGPYRSADRRGGSPPCPAAYA